MEYFLSISAKKFQKKIETAYEYFIYNIHRLPTPGGEVGVEIVEGAAHSELDAGMTEAMARALDSLVEN